MIVGLKNITKVYEKDTQSFITRMALFLEDTKCKRLPNENK